MLPVLLATCTPGLLPEGKHVVIRSDSYWEFNDLEKVEPSPDWQRWHSEVEECLDLEADFREIHWYTSTEMYTPAKLKLSGLHWNREGASMIILAEQDKNTVKHEVAHFVLHAHAVKRHHWNGEFWRCINA